MRNVKTTRKRKAKSPFALVGRKIEQTSVEDLMLYSALAGMAVCQYQHSKNGNPYHIAGFLTGFLAKAVTSGAGGVVAGATEAAAQPGIQWQDLAVAGALGAVSGGLALPVAGGYLGYQAVK